jgi:hypothetical protein
MCGAGLNLCIERDEEEAESSSVMPSGAHEATAVYQGFCVLTNSSAIRSKISS